MEIVQDVALKLKLPDDITKDVLARIPKSERHPDNDLMVYWGFEEACWLAHYIDQKKPDPALPEVPSPMLRDYKWPGIFTPFEHQKTTASFLSIRPRAFCFNEAGTGKTSAAIWAADYLMNLGLVKRVLIICPLSIMYTAWQADVMKTAMHRSCGVAHGTVERRRKILAGMYEFCIINYDGVSVVRDTIAQQGFDLLIVDECFVAGSLVSTPSGKVSIESLSTGDLVLTSSGAKRIRTVTRNTTKQLVKITTTDGKEITCTHDHPFFTEQGWVSAQHLTGRRLLRNNEVSYMQRGLPYKNTISNMANEIGYPDWNDMQQILRSEEISSTESGSIILQSDATGRTRESIGDSTIRGIQKENVVSVETNRAQAEEAWRQWAGHDALRANCFRDATTGVYLELPSSVGKEAAWLSYLLQTRLWKSDIESGAGSRWGHSPFIREKTTRSKEGEKVAGTWVASVTYIECSRPETIYNLDVEGTPNYFVEDCLVHNCNAYKNTSTKRWKTLAKLIVPSTRLWMMTGTPASQSPIDAFGLSKLVSPYRVPKFMTAWRDKVLHQLSRFKWVPKQTAKQDVFYALQPAVRFTKKECLDLPDLVYETRDVPLTPQVSSYYKKLKTQMLVEAAGENISAVNAAASMSKLLQISGGAVYTDQHAVVEFDVSPRLNVLLEVLEEASHKSIVFVPYLHTIEVITRFLDDNGYSNAVIRGDVTARERANIIDRFQRDRDPQVLVIQPQAASHGITLTAADTLVFWSPVLSVETFLQCVGRIDRVGQVNKMLVVMLQGSDVERKTYAALQNRVDSHIKLTDLYKQVME
jgi:superfamily II DNA or RNA helicase